jgi:UDP-glucose 4-epimerase
MPSKKILLTGSTGFIGRDLDASLVIKGFDVLNVVRILDLNLVGPAFATNISPLTDWSICLKDIDVVIHSAGRVHVMNEDALDPLKEYRYQNVESTLHLANSAAAMGVKRFIFISSIKVFGEKSSAGEKFFADSSYAPSDPYGVSKMEAEIGLKLIADRTILDVVIIRLPLVYGPGVKANFLSMMTWLRRGIPLPLGGIKNNRRSFIYIDNLVDVIAKCINHPAAANQIFLVSDDEDLSTTLLLGRMAEALGVSSKLIPVPESLIGFGANLIGRSDIAHRLCGSLQVDIQKTKDLLDWAPPVSVDEGLRQTAAHFLKMQS